jgi:hypothetical protein
MYTPRKLVNPTIAVDPYSERATAMLIVYTATKVMLLLPVRATCR